ncbi:MAG: PhnD/SsuA/transferrin family substrate-binding protein, partial [Gammaproteobacteria bacterium]|nr:PhnD/SsuA/transferrin family substrate-binding protein [Gammaproteobacteria bacterium]
GPDSPLRTVQDLKGKRVAFGSHTSTQGHWIPRIMFDEAGIDLDDLAGYIYTGSHRACAEAVIAGRVEACGMQDTLARSLVTSGSVRALAVSEVYPSSGVFSHGGVPENVRAAVQAALVEFDPQGRDRAGLYHWNSTEMAGGFAPASDDDYALLRIQAEDLGLLPSNATPGASQ